MGKSAFDKIAAGLEDALAYAEGDENRGVAHAMEPAALDVAALRRRLGLTQAKFAETYDLDVAAVRDWEQGRRRPDRAARAYLKVIDRLPDAVRLAHRVEG